MTAAGSETLTRIAARSSALLACAVLAIAAGIVSPFGALDFTGLDRWFLCVVALTLGVIALSTSRRAPLFGLIAAALILGGAAQLSLIEPRWFTNFRSPSGVMDYFMLGIVALQAVAAMSALFVLRPAGLLAGIQRVLGAGRALAWFALCAAFTVSIMGFLLPLNLYGYGARLAVGAIFLGINLLTLLALGLASPPEGRFSRPAATPWVLAGVTFIASALLAWFAFERVPHVEDEVAFMFQARTFTAGLLGVPAPVEAAQAALEYYLLEIRGDQWIAVTAPGWPAVLALGVLIGAPWLINPLLAGLAVLLAHGVARPIVGPARADLVCLLFATSPWLLGLSATLMTHSLCLVLMLLAWWLLVRIPEASGLRAAGIALCAGLALGGLFTTRPLDGVIVGILSGSWLLWRFGLRSHWSTIAAYIAGCIATGLLYLTYNWAVTGDPLVAPLADYLARSWGGGSNAIGFGLDIGPPDDWGRLDTYSGHSPLEGVTNTLGNLSSLDFELSGWRIGSLAPIWALLLWARLREFDRAMLVVVACVIGAHFFFWFAGNFYAGPRYWFSAFFALTVLAASGIATLSGRLRAAGIVDAAQRVGWPLAVLCLFGLVVFTSWRGVAKYHEYGNFHAGFQSISAREDLGGALVIVKKRGDVGSALFFNDPLLPSDKPIFVRDLGKEANAAVIAAFPDRKAVYLEDLSD